MLDAPDRVCQAALPSRALRFAPLHLGLLLGLK